MSIQFGPEWNTFASRLNRTPQQMDRDIRRTMTVSLLMIERDARTGAPQDTRRLAGSINHTPEGQMGVFPRLQGSVGPSVRYGMAVEFGRPAGAKMPPVDALMGWVRRHFSPNRGKPARAGRQRYRAWQKAGDNALRSAAFALAVSIKRRADRGDNMARPFMGPAFNRNRARISSMFSRIGLRTTAYLAGKPIP